jgi:SAM-dependent methyltransferase
MSDPKQQVESNRALWNKWTAVHLESDFYHVDTFKSGDNRIRDYEIAEVGDVTDKELLHLQCHFGLDTLSWARLGARVTGIDYSEAAIAAAQTLAKDVGIDAQFVHSNVYDLPNALDGEFDIVYTSRGVLGWLPDLEAWAEVVARFMKPGGTFYITEAHPILWVFDDDESATELRPRYDYFFKDALAFPVKGSYADPEADVDHETEFGWDHTLSAIINSLLQQGLQLEFLHEFDFLDWPAPFLVRSDEGRYVFPESQKGSIPLMFSLKATKPAK